MTVACPKVFSHKRLPRRPEKPDGRSGRHNSGLVPFWRMGGDEWDWGRSPVTGARRA